MLIAKIIGQANKMILEAYFSCYPLAFLQYKVTLGTFVFTGFLLGTFFFQDADVLCLKRVYFNRLWKCLWIWQEGSLWKIDSKMTWFYIKYTYIDTHICSSHSIYSCIKLSVKTTHFARLLSTGYHTRNCQCCKQ